jgi:two-component system LytT family response regulator
MSAYILRVAIADDEPAARLRLRRLTEELGHHVVVEVANGLEALERIPAAAPDVVLLDVEMPEVDGLDVARRLQPPRPFIVFATAYEQYAHAAFDAEALDFVVKPIDTERLARAFDRAHRRLTEQRAMVPLTPELMAALSSSLRRSDRPQVPRRLLVRHLSGHRLVAVADIDRFRAADDVVWAVMGATESIVDMSLDELATRMLGRFVRINRQDLIAARIVDRLESNGDGSATVVTTDGARWRVSRRRTAAVKEALTS